MVDSIFDHRRALQDYPGDAGKNGPVPGGACRQSIPSLPLYWMIPYGSINLPNALYGVDPYLAGFLPVGDDVANA